MTSHYAVSCLVGEIDDPPEKMDDPIIKCDFGGNFTNRWTMEGHRVNDPQEAIENVSGVQRVNVFSGLGETYIVR